MKRLIFIALCAIFFISAEVFAEDANQKNSGSSATESAGSTEKSASADKGAKASGSSEKGAGATSSSNKSAGAAGSADKGASGAGEAGEGVSVSSDKGAGESSDNVANAGTNEGEGVAGDVSSLSPVPKQKKEKPPKPVTAKLGSKKWTLLPPKACPKTIDLTAAISGKFGKTAVDFNVVFTVADVMTLVIMDDFMVTLGEVTFDGVTLTNTCPILSEELAAAILCDMEFLYYKDEELAASIAPLKMRLLVHGVSGTTFRIVMTKDKSLRQQELKGEEIAIDNFSQKYHYTLTIIEDKSVDKPTPEEAEKPETKPEEAKAAE